jgi:phage terminase small subunit
MSEEVKVEDTQPKKLSAKYRRFVDAYLTTWNATDAWQKTHPKCTRESARRQGSLLLTNIDVSNAITARLAEVHMGADEVLKLLADMARGDMGEFMDIGGTYFNLDLQGAKEKGLTKLIKKVKQKTTIFSAKKESDEDREVTETEIELYDAQAALEKIGRHHHLFKDELDITSGGEKITIKLVKDENDGD